MKQLIAFVFLLTVFTLPARAQRVTGGKLLADCHEQIHFFNVPTAQVGDRTDAAILANRQYNAGTCLGAILVGFGMNAGDPTAKKYCELNKVLGHSVEDWVQAFVKYGDAHQLQIENLLAGNAITTAFLHTYCSAALKK